MGKTTLTLKCRGTNFGWASILTGLFNLGNMPKIANVKDFGKGHFHVKISNHYQSSFESHFTQYHGRIVCFSVSSLTIFFFLQRSFTGRFLQGLGCVPVQLILNAAIFPFIIPRIATLGLFTKAYTIVTSQARKIQLLSRNS